LPLVIPPLLLKKNKRGPEQPGKWPSTLTGEEDQRISGEHRHPVSRRIYTAKSTVCRFQGGKGKRDGLLWEKKGHLKMPGGGDEASKVFRRRSKEFGLSE